MLILFITSTLMMRCETFHIATKIRQKPLCGQKLVDRILSQCMNSAETNQPNMLPLNTEAEDPNHNPEDNSICCHGIACHSDVIREYCDFW